MYTEMCNRTQCIFKLASLGWLFGAEKRLHEVTPRAIIECSQNVNEICRIFVLIPIKYSISYLCLQLNILSYEESKWFDIIPSKNVAFSEKKFFHGPYLERSV